MKERSEGSTMAATVHRLKVTLRSVEPPIWRRDGWQHNVVLEAIEPFEPAVEYPRCLAGRRACPPEDCGGPWGFQELLEAIADPDHPRHPELTEWLPPDSDPVRFAPEEATADMRSPRPFADDIW